MELKYQRAIKVGLICGLVLAVIYFAGGLAGMWLNSTPAMQDYMSKVVEPFKDMWKDWPNHVQPVTYPQGVPTPPPEYYIGMVVSMALLGAMAIGMLLTGALAVRADKQADRKLSDAAYAGALSGAAAFLPIFIVMLIMSAISAVWGNQSSLLGTMLPPGMMVSVPAIVLSSVCCCCLPISFILMAVMAAIGALIYVILAGRPAPPATPPNP